MEWARSAFPVWLATWRRPKATFPPLAITLLAASSRNQFTTTGHVVGYLTPAVYDAVEVGPMKSMRAPLIHRSQIMVFPAGELSLSSDALPGSSP
jgi:hypothetical protein